MFFLFRAIKFCRNRARSTHVILMTPQYSSECPLVEITTSITRNLPGYSIFYEAWFDVYAFLVRKERDRIVSITVRLSCSEYCTECCMERLPFIFKILYFRACVLILVLTLQDCLTISYWYAESLRQVHNNCEWFTMKIYYHVQLQCNKFFKENRKWS